MVLVALLKSWYRALASETGNVLIVYIYIVVF